MEDSIFQIIVEFSSEPSTVLVPVVANITKKKEFDLKTTDWTELEAYRTAED
jgi:hypothetical protein